MEQMAEAPVTLLVTMRELPVLPDRLVLPEGLLIPVVLSAITIMLALWVCVLTQQEMLLLREAREEPEAMRDTRVQPEQHTPRRVPPVLMAAPEGREGHCFPEASLGCTLVWELLPLSP